MLNVARRQAKVPLRDDGQGQPKPTKPFIIDQKSEPEDIDAEVDADLPREDVGNPDGYTADGDGGVTEDGEDEDAEYEYEPENGARDREMEVVVSDADVESVASNPSEDGEIMPDDFAKKGLEVIQ